MRRIWLIHAAFLAIVAIEWWLVPREAWAPVVAISVVLMMAWLAYVIVSPRAQLFVPTVHRGPVASRSMALTFDDGPDPRWTPRILDVLRDHGAKATFFVVGERALRHPELVRRMLDEGHLVGSHSHTHAMTFHFWSPSHIASDIERGIEAIRRVTGKHPAYFRPPHGLRVPTLRGAMCRMGERWPICVTWSARALDTLGHDAERLVNRLLPRLEPGAILALHDGSGYGGSATREPTIEALTVLLREARARDLESVRIDVLLER